jgi:hypothetical protein
VLHKAEGFGRVAGSKDGQWKREERALAEEFE